MPSDFSQFKQFSDSFEDNARQAMQELAEETESYMKDNANWKDDTGAARASLTGFEIKTGDPYKNTNDPNWVGARTGRIVSRYRNTFPENTEAHYAVHTEPLPLTDDNPTAVVSSLIAYAEEIENSLQNGNTFVDGLSFMERNALPILKKHLKL